MAPEEYRKHVAAGTCFRCGMPYSPTHKCLPRTLQVLIQDEDEPEAMDDPNPDVATPDAEEDLTLQHIQLSELSTFGIDSFHTMQLRGQVRGHQVHVMVDSGASHCFVSQQTVRRLKLDVRHTVKFAVRLGNGSRVMSGGLCENIPLVLNSTQFMVNGYVFPLRGVDLILGISWLATLGEVRANWRNLTMEFSLAEQPIKLQGDPALTKRECSSTELHSLLQSEEGWMLWALAPEGPAKEALPESNAQHRKTLEELLACFPTVTSPPTELPPTRTHDHRIELHPGAQPVSVRPYRYNHLQKDEMERLVAEMLAAGII